MAGSTGDSRATGDGRDQGRAARTDSRHVGSWLGAAASALGLGASLTIVIRSAQAIAAEGGYVAEGGPYVIAHPVPDGFWLFPLSFIGMFAFPIVHAVFASRINGFRLVFFTWCALWTGIGLVTLYDAFNPPGGGFSWVWLVMGVIFSLVGLGSTAAYVMSLRAPDREASSMPGPQRVPYAVLVVAMLAAGVAVGFAVFDAVIAP